MPDTTIQDFADVFALAEAENGLDRRIDRIVVHPQDFQTIRKQPVFDGVWNPVLQATQVSGAGLLWGINVYVDPRAEQGKVYIVSRLRSGAGQNIGRLYQLHPKPGLANPRRTAWARVLEDDLV